MEAPFDGLLLFIIILTCYISVPSFIYNLCQVLLLRNHLKLRLIVMSTNLENRERGRQRKRESRATGQRSSTRKGARAREKKKIKGDIFCWRNKMKFCSSEMLAATRVKMSDSEKRVNKNTSDIPSIKRVTRKFLHGSFT